MMLQKIFVRFQIQHFSKIFVHAKLIFHHLLNATVINLRGIGVIFNWVFVAIALAFITVAVLFEVVVGQPTAAHIMAVGIDTKLIFDSKGQRQYMKPGTDQVLFFDIGVNPEAPRLLGSLPLNNSVVGPPTNLAVTPDNRLALVANSLKWVSDGANWKPSPDDKLFVIDLTSRPPRLLDTLTVGQQPSGVSINADGTMALVANREGKSISVITIRGRNVKVTDTIAMNDVVSAIAITPDGSRALATKFAAHKVSLLSIKDGKIRYDGYDLPVGLWPYNVSITPDGKLGLVTNIGKGAASDGNADTVSVVDLDANPPRVVNHVTVGDAPEGLGIAPQGGLAVATLLQGSYDAPKNAWYKNQTGRVTALKIAGKKVTAMGGVDVGSFPEGIGFSANGKYIYVGNYPDKSISILRVDGNKIVNTGKFIRLPGPPASLRVGSN
jgi:DNA-binding beta-propeller fold protein YncE